MQELITAAEDVPGGRSVVDPDDPRFAAPGDLPRGSPRRVPSPAKPCPPRPQSSHV